MRVAFQPLEARYRVVILDPAEQMRPEAHNSLLKTLEEPRQPHNHYSRHDESIHAAGNHSLAFPNAACLAKYRRIRLSGI